jgi:hypothetical protein
VGLAGFAHLDNAPHYRSRCNSGPSDSLATTLLGG